MTRATTEACQPEVPRGQPPPPTHDRRGTFSDPPWVLPDRLRGRSRLSVIRTVAAAIV